VLSNFGGAGGINDSEIRSDDDVRDSRVGGRIAEALIDKALTVDEVIDLKFLAFLVQIMDGGIEVSLVL
jgi:hypothetical protein